jgi:predicted O-linked N-acetylglucosamine transferase (SPINDLY family)
VQASWLGYFATTGLPAMDWLLTDAASVPAGEEWHFTERVWRLPHRLCFAAPADAPAVAPAPLLVQGYATFGSFQNLGKVGDDVLAAWGRVLARMPTARLRLQNPQLGDASQRAALAQRLGRHGVAPERVAMHGKTSRGRYLAAHAEVDVLLDTFPYPGGTTTCEALWMGVPTVTLEGDRMLARQGRALLRSAGLGDWVAASVDAYVDLAVAAVADAQRLAALRAGMRDAVARSPLFDGRGFARDFMAAMEAIAGRA